MKSKILLKTVMIFVLAWGINRLPAQNLNAGHSTRLQLLDNASTSLILKNSVGTITTRTVKTPEGTFIQLQIPKYTKSHIIGAPEMPVRRQLIEVPLKAHPKVIILSAKEKVFKLDDYGIVLPIVPAQPPQPKSGILPPFAYNKTVYKTNAFPSQSPVTVDVLGIMRAVQLGRINIHPITYNPVTNTLHVYQELEFKVVFENADLAATEALQEKYYSPYFTSLYENLMNYRPVSPRENLTQYPVKYAIVADRMFQSQLAPFIAWKRRKGFTVDVAYTDSIGNNTTAIKAYLQALYNAGTPEDPAPSFALFVGDVAQVAVWNNGNGVTDRNSCEFTGDLYPEMYYGRFSAQTTAQLQPQIDKTLEYEQYTMPDPSYLDSVVMIAGMDSGHGHDWGNGQINYGTINYFNDAHAIFSNTYLYPESGNHSADIIQNISDGVSFANYTAHGSEDGWYNPAFHTSDIPGLQNQDKYGLLIGNCCLTSSFQVSECFAEALLRAPNKGALGYIGGSNSTYWDEDYYFGVGVGAITETPPSYEETTLGNYDRVWHDHGEAFGDWFTTMDQQVAAGCLAVTASGSSAEAYYWDIYNLMGDPSLMIYYSQPAVNPVTHDQFIMIGTTSFTVHAAPYSYVALNDNGVLKAAALADSNGVAVLNFTPFSTPGNAELIVSAQNRQPWIENIQVFAPNGPYCIYEGHTYNDDSLGNGNNHPDFDELVLLNLSMVNYGNENANNVNVVLSSTDPFITLLDTIENFDTLFMNQTVTKNNAYLVHLANNVPDQYHIPINVLATDENDSSWHSNFTIKANAPDLLATDLLVDDSEWGNDNGLLDPGETAIIRLKVVNRGHCNAQNADVSLIPYNAYVEVLSSDTVLSSVSNFGSYFPQFLVQVDSNAPIGIFAEMHSHILCGGYDVTNIFYPKIGRLMEDWETGDFTKFNWQQGGDQPWEITNQYPFAGFYDAKSGAIQNNQTSELFISYQVMSPDSITFWRKVSSEQDYDKLNFYIDNNLMDSWSGTSVGWKRQAYFVSSGMHQFRWAYEKDYSNASGSDCGWIDNIGLPNMLVTTIYAGPDGSTCAGNDFDCHGTATNFDTLYWATSGTGTFADGNSFNAIYTPSDDDIAAGQVALSFNQIDVDGNPASDTMSLVFGTVPAAPLLPEGPEAVDLSQVTSSNYTTDPVLNADNYFWSIYPDSAGVVNGGDTLATVAWNMDYEGEAWIKVAAINGCGQGIFSDSLLVVVTNPMGIANLNSDVGLFVWPNPTHGLLKLQLNVKDNKNLKVQIVNQLGQVVYKKSTGVFNKQWNAAFDLTPQKAGIYYLIVTGKQVRIIKKIILR